MAPDDAYVRWTMYNTHDGPWQTGAAYVRWTKYDVRFGEFPRLRARLAKFAVLLAYLFFIHGKRMGKWVE